MFTEVVLALIENAEIVHEYPAPMGESLGTRYQFDNGISVYKAGYNVAVYRDGQRIYTEGDA